MANPMAPYPANSPENGVVDLYMEFPITDSSGTPGTVTGGREFAATAVSRTGTGAYDIFLAQPWIRLLAVDIFPVGANSTTAGKDVEVITDAAANTTTPKISILFTRRDTNAAADPAQNDVIKVGLTLKCKNP